jgi:hypothetical protein
MLMAGRYVANLVIYSGLDELPMLPQCLPVKSGFSLEPGVGGRL